MSSSTDYTGNNTDIEASGATSKVNRKQPNPSDPFARRQGKTLVWRNVNMTLVSLFLLH